MVDKNFDHVGESVAEKGVEPARQANGRPRTRWKSGKRGAARLAAVPAGESPAGAILSLAP